MQNFKISLLCYWLAYVIVTAIGILHTIFNIYVLHMKSMKESEGMGEGYEKTKPWHPLYNIIVFPLFSYIYFRTLDTITFQNVIITSIVWGTITVLFDLLGWVIIKHPWSLSAKEFYVDYQPWISLIYVAIYVSPFMAYGFINL